MSSVQRREDESKTKAVGDKEAAVAHISQSGVVCSFPVWDNVHQFVCLQI